MYISSAALHCTETLIREACPPLRFPHAHVDESVPITQPSSFSVEQANDGSSAQEAFLPIKSLFRDCICHIEQSFSVGCRSVRGHSLHDKTQRVNRVECGCTKLVSELNHHRCDSRTQSQQDVVRELQSSLVGLLERLILLLSQPFNAIYRPGEQLLCPDTASTVNLEAFGSALLYSNRRCRSLLPSQHAAGPGTQQQLLHAPHSNEKSPSENATLHVDNQRENVYICTIFQTDLTAFLSSE